MSIPFETSFNRQSGGYGASGRPSQALRHQRRVVALVGGILGASSLMGVALNRSLTHRSPVAAAVDTDNAPAEFALEAARRESVDATPVAAPAAAVPAVETAVRHTSVQRLPDLRFSDVTPPENPFRPVAPPAAAPGQLPSFAGAPALPPVFSAPLSAPGGGAEEAAFVPAPKSVKPAPRPAAPESTGPKADELAVTGIIQGDPAIAVVRHGGQSLFLKIGDQVADTWRLVAIGERSATFQNGEQRVEIPIKGGNS